MPKKEGMTMDSPEYRAMKQVIHSEAGRKAALDATHAGFPALCGVDPLLRRALGEDYSQANLGPINAGYEVAAVMRRLGYTEAGMGVCPNGCVARSGRKWMPKVAV
jgi:hypothetical protein